MSDKKNIGRPKINPNYDPIGARDEMANAVAELYLHPNSDMDIDKDGHASMKSLELYFGLTMTKIRKLLVSANVYHFYKDGVDMVKAVNDLHNKGYSLEQIKDCLNISTGTANSLLPYKLGTYNADFTADNYDYSNVSVDARRKRNQRKREKMKNADVIDNRKNKVKELEVVMAEQNKTFKDRYKEKEKEELKQKRIEARKWLMEKGFVDRSDIYHKVVDKVKSGELKVTDIPNIKKTIGEDKIKELENNEAGAINHLFSYVKHLMDFIEAEEEIKDPNIKTIGKKFESSRYVHGKLIGDYIFRPKKNEYYKDSYDEIIEEDVDMFGVIDENKIPHMFVINQIDRLNNVILRMIEVYRCNKNGKLYSKHTDTAYEFETFGPSDNIDELVKKLIEKCVIALQNLSLTRQKDIGYNPDSHMVKDGYLYMANDVGTIVINDDENGEVYFQIDGKRYQPYDVMKLFSSYCGFVMRYQIGDITDDALESDMTLMPIRIDEDTLSSELHDLLFALSENHNCNFISYENVAAFDVLFSKLMDKLKFYYNANPRAFGKEAANKLISILKTVGTDDDVFPEYEIMMVKEAVKDLWEE